MVRVDIPTLKCDRCATTTQDTREMGSFRALTYYHMSGEDKWDLCPACWQDFQTFLKNEPKVEPMRHREMG